MWPARSRARKFSLLLLRVAPNQAKSSLPICVQTLLAPRWRAGVVHADPRRRLQASPQHLAVLREKRGLAVDQQAHDLAFGDADADRLQQRDQPLDGDLALMMLHEHETAQFGSVPLSMLLGLSDGRPFSPFGRAISSRCAEIICFNSATSPSRHTTRAANSARDRPDRSAGGCMTRANRTRPRRGKPLDQPSHGILPGYNTSA